MKKPTPNEMTFRDFDKKKRYNVGRILRIGNNRWKVVKIDGDYVKTERVAE